MIKIGLFFFTTLFFISVFAKNNDTKSIKPEQVQTINSIDDTMDSDFFADEDSTDPLTQEITAYQAKPEVAKPKTPWQEWLANNKFRLKYMMTHFYASLSGKDNNVSYYELNAESSFHFLKNNLIKYDLYLGATSESGVQYGYIGDVRNSDKKAKYMDFKQLYYQYQGAHYHLLLGKVIINNKMAHWYSITDHYNRVNLINYQEPIIIGKWQLRSEYFIDDNDQLDLSIFPLAAYGNTLASTARWYGTTGNNVSLGLRVPVDTQSNRSNIRSDAIKNWSYLFQYKAIRDGYDFFIANYYGVSNYAMLIQKTAVPLLLQTRKPMVDQFSAGIVKIKDAWKFYAELFYQYTFHQRDINFLDTLLGVQYQETTLANKLGLEKIEPTIELTNERITRQQSFPKAYESSQLSHLGTNNIIMSLLLKKSDKLSGLLLYNYDYRYAGYMAAVGLRYYKTDNLWFQINVNHYAGDNASIFGVWQNNSSLNFQVDYNF